MEFRKVNSLPLTGEENVFYFLRKANNDVTLHVFTENNWIEVNTVGEPQLEPVSNHFISRSGK